MVHGRHHFLLCSAPSFIGVLAVAGDGWLLVGGEGWPLEVLSVHVGASQVSQFRDTGAPPCRWADPSATALSRGRARSDSIANNGQTGRNGTSWNQTAGGKYIHRLIWDTLKWPIGWLKKLNFLLYRDLAVFFVRFPVRTSVSFYVSFLRLPYVSHTSLFYTIFSFFPPK